MKIVEKRKQFNSAYEMERPFNIIIDRHFSEEEKQENYRNSKPIMAAGNNAWNEHCEIIRKMFAEKVDALLMEFESHFSIGQLHNDGDQYPNYDLWFWCNGEDHSYVTLDFIWRYNGVATDEIVGEAKRIEAMYKKALEILEAYNDPNLCATIQFHRINFPQKMEKMAKAKAVELNGKWVTLNGVVGKFWINDDGKFCFKQKFAKKHYCYLNNEMLMRCMAA